MRPASALLLIAAITVVQSAPTVLQPAATPTVEEQDAVRALVDAQEPAITKLCTTHWQGGKRQSGRSPGTLPTAVSTTRTLWTAALAAYADQTASGDFVETGTFTGGTAIVMMDVLDRANSTKRFFGADSFQGLPDQDAADRDDGCDATAGNRDERAACSQGQTGTYKTSKDVFEANVLEAGVHRDRLEVVEGWFNETLPPAKLDAISFLRLDGDMYASTMDAIKALYPLVSDGGLIYVDDYGTFAGCARAIEEYRASARVSAPMHRIKEEAESFQRINGEPMADEMQKKYNGRTEAVWWVKREGECLGVKQCFANA